MIRFPKTVLVSHLENHIRCKVGWKGLQILIYGWLKFRKYGDKYTHAVQARNYLFLSEVQDLSLYAGYDLTKKSS